MKRLVVLFVLFIFIISSGLAVPELWVSVGFSAERENVSEGLRNSLKSNLQLVEKGLYSNGNLDYINTMGPLYEVIFFPYEKIKLGIYAAGSTNFILSQNGKYYRSYNFDHSQNARIGIAYNQFFGGNTGFFIDLAYDFSWYKIAGVNAYNSKMIPDYSRYFEKNIFFDFGYLSRYKKNFFKIGFGFSKPIMNEYNDGLGVTLFTTVGLYL